MTLEHLKAIYHQPFFDLLEQARKVHQTHWKGKPLQLCALLSIKSGGCSEDCAYCAQSSRYSTHVKREGLIPVEQVVSAAVRAKAAGATRLCMGAAWRGIDTDDPRFLSILEMVRRVRETGLEACITLGVLSPSAAQQLQKAGLTVYNHNLDTGEEFFPKIVSTHSFRDRLENIRRIREAGIGLCCGGIIGMGESVDDRLSLLQTLSSMTPPPDSVPINCLIPIPGTPLEKQPPVPSFELIRLIATARIAMPQARVRLAAGRLKLSPEAQALCFYAGANSIFHGEKLLTTNNQAPNQDIKLLQELDLLPEDLLGKAENSLQPSA
ncbi:MAG: biotin synthase BioB [Verrucomicrobiae bacterium]|nr:biotin synthase BioB [Verrucomicrobiae bacterium]